MCTNSVVRSILMATVLAASLACISCRCKKTEAPPAQTGANAQPEAIAPAAAALPQADVNRVVEAPADWTHDWKLFAAAIAPYVKQGEMASADAQMFVGRTVTWEGTVVDLTWADDAGSVNLAMPPVEIILPDGSTNAFQSLSLAPKGVNVAGWKDVKTNDTVRFKTTLGAMGDDGVRIPAVFILMQGVSGTDFAGVQFVMIMTDDGELLSKR